MTLSPWHKFLRFILGLYPLQIGKGWVAAMYHDKNVPAGEQVRTRDGVIVNTRPDFVFKHVFLFREFEPVNTAIFRRIVKPGDVCVDAGANFGYYTALFARWGARVYAFEPVPSTFALTEETVRLNQCESAAKPFNCGLGDQLGTIRIYQFRNLSHGHASTSDLGRNDAVPQDCQITTLDAFCTEHSVPRISFMKIDVEGFEYEVLKGGQKTLTQPDAPTLHFEVNAACAEHRKMDPNQIVALLQSYGYTDFLQIKRYGGVRKAPAVLPVANFDYVAFKNRELAAQVLRG